MTNSRKLQRVFGAHFALKRCSPARLMMDFLTKGCIFVIFVNGVFPHIDFYCHNFLLNSVSFAFCFPELTNFVSFDPFIPNTMFSARPIPIQTEKTKRNLFNRKKMILRHGTTPEKINPAHSP